MKEIKKYLYRTGPSISTAIGLFVLLGGIASAATAPTDVIPNSQKIVDILCAGLNWMFWFLIVLSIAMALYAGYQYTTSNGDPEKVSTATKTLTYVAVAVVVAILAKGVPLIIGDFFGVSGLSVCSGGGSNTQFYNF